MKDTLAAITYFDIFIRVGSSFDGAGIPGNFLNDTLLPTPQP